MRLFVTGALGMLGRRLVEEAVERGHEVAGRDRPELELLRPEEAAAQVRAFHPDLLLHAAALTDVDGCETNADEAMAVNGTASGALAEAAADIGAACLYVSTDYVFDGAKAEPYLEDDPTGPTGVYGRSKLAGEEAVRGAGGAVARLSWSFGPDGANFVRTIAGKLAAGETLRVVDDQVGSPTYTRDAAAALLDLAEAGPVGVYHVCNSGHTSWFGFARAIAAGMGLPVARVQPCGSEDFPRPAPRPANSRLGGRRLPDLRGPLPLWEDALTRYLEEEGWLQI